jgi:hypothetical protein
MRTFLCAAIVAAFLPTIVASSASAQVRFSTGASVGAPAVTPAPSGGGGAPTGGGSPSGGGGSSAGGGGGSSAGGGSGSQVPSVSLNVAPLSTGGNSAAGGNGSLVNGNGNGSSKSSVGSGSNNFNTSLQQYIKQTVITKIADITTGPVNSGGGAVLEIVNVYQ